MSRDSVYDVALRRTTYHGAERRLRHICTLHLSQISKLKGNLSFELWNYAQLVHNKQNKTSVLRDVNDLHEVIAAEL